MEISVMKRSTLYLLVTLALFALLLGAVVAGGIARTRRDLLATSVLHGETILRSLEMAAANSLRAEEVVDGLVADLLSREAALAERLLAGGAAGPEEVEEILARGSGAGLWVVGPDERVRYRPRAGRTPRQGRPSPEDAAPPDFCLMRNGRGATPGGRVTGPGGGPFRRSGGIAVARPLAAGGSFALELPTERVAALRSSLSVDSWLRALAGKHDLVRLEFLDPAGRELASAGVTPEGAATRRELRAREGLRAAVLAAPGGRLLELTSPFSFEGQEVGTFRILLSLRQADASAARSRRTLLAAAGAALAIGLASLAWLILSQARYYRRLNAMQRELDGKERLASLGELAGAMAHEIRNPLNAISIAIQRWSRRSTDGSGEDVYPVVKGEIARLDRLVEDVLTMARPEEVVFSRVEMGPLVEGAAALYAADAEARGIAVETRVGQAPEVPGDRAKLHQVLVNLMANAMQVLPDGGRVRLSAATEGTEAVIRVEDNGPGIPPEDLERIFDVFHTTREKGIGLGLAISRRIVEAHGGTLTAGAGAGGGAVFTIRLPLAGKGEA